MDEQLVLDVHEDDDVDEGAPLRVCHHAVMVSSCRWGTSARGLACSVPRSPRHRGWHKRTMSVPRWWLGGRRALHLPRLAQPWRCLTHKHRPFYPRVVPFPCPSWSYQTRSLALRRRWAVDLWLGMQWPARLGPWWASILVTTRGGGGAWAHFAWGKKKQKKRVKSITSL